MLSFLFTSRRMGVLWVLVLYQCLFAMAHAAVGQALPASQWQRPGTAYSYALYFTDKKGAAPDKIARALAANPQYGFQVFSKLDASAKDKHVLMLQTIAGNVAQDYRPPSLEMLKHFGRGVSLEQAQSVQKSPQVLILFFATPTPDALPVLLKATKLVHQLANQTGALIWDEETRELFSPEAWKTSRIDTWEGRLPDVTRHITIHAYNDDGKMRAVTLGMNKFALPDLVINDLTWSLSSPLGDTINLVAQSLLEGARPSNNGQFDVKVAAIQHQAMRTKVQSTIAQKGTGRGQVLLYQSTPQDGDPSNTLAELRFDTAAGKDTTSRQTAFANGVFGVQEDAVFMSKKNDTELQTASERAKKKLPALKAAFQAGLQPGEIILLKAPFATTDDSVEWMWVEVTQWPGEQITGILRNEPRYVPSLKAGQTVQVKQSEIFDYMRRTADGKKEGNETGDILSRRPK